MSAVPAAGKRFPHKVRRGSAGWTPAVAIIDDALLALLALLARVAGSGKNARIPRRHALRGARAFYSHARAADR